MPDNAYADATPDSAANVDITAVATDMSTITADQNAEAATPNYQGPLGATVQHLKDQEVVSLDDYAIQEQQRALDVAALYGASGSSDIAQAQANLAALQAKKTSDQNLP